MFEITDRLHSGSWLLSGFFLSKTSISESKDCQHSSTDLFHLSFKGEKSISTLNCSRTKLGKKREGVAECSLKFHYRRLSSCLNTSHRGLFCGCAAATEVIPMSPSRPRPSCAPCKLSLEPCHARMLPADACDIRSDPCKSGWVCRRFF